MKKTLLSIFSICLIGAASVFGQCTPTLLGPGGNIVPDTTVNLDTAYVGMAYSMVIQLYVPADTTFQGTTVDVDDFTIVNVTGMPTGFNWAANPTSAVFPGGSAGCLLISAPASAVTASIAGANDIVVSVEAHGLGGLITLPVEVSGYNIFVSDPNGIADNLDAADFAVGQNVPNPFRGESIISYNTPYPTNVELKVFDILGKVVETKRTMSESGINEFVLDASKTPAGIYFYSVSNGAKTITKRFVVAK